MRLFNPSDRTVKNSVRLNGGKAGPQKVQSPVERLRAEFELPKAGGSGWQKVRLVNLEEIPQEDLEMDSGGWVSFEITGKKILTLEFQP